MRVPIEAMRTTAMKEYTKLFVTVFGTSKKIFFYSFPNRNRWRKNRAVRIFKGIKHNDAERERGQTDYDVTYEVRKERLWPFQLFDHRAIDKHARVFAP